VQPSRLKYGRGKYCSNECKNEDTFKKLIKQVECECSVCGKVFYRHPSQIKSEHQFCSKKCMYKGISLGIIKNGIRPKIVNVVATGKLPNDIDLTKAYTEIDVPLKEYEPETYPGLLVKINVNGNLRHVTIYKNGKYIIAGASSEEDVNNIYEAIVKKLRDIGI